MTTLQQVIARQMTLTGERLMDALEPLTAAEFFAGLPTGYSPGWTLTHLTCVADLFSSWFDGVLLYDHEFHKVFNDTGISEPEPFTRAASIDQDLYPMSLLLHRFPEAMRKALRALAAFPVQQWDAPPPRAVPAIMPTGGWVWEHLGLHTAWHCGELAGSMERFYGTYSLNVLSHRLALVPPEGS